MHLLWEKKEPQNVVANIVIFQEQTGRNIITKKWTLHKLCEHASKIENKELYLKISAEGKRVKSPPVFTALDFLHCIISILHIPLGKSNTLLKDFIAET